MLVPAIQSALVTPVLAELGGWRAITENQGFAIAITGMTIVFVALTLITCFIAALPHLLEALSPYLPSFDSHHSAQPSNPERTQNEEERIVAAIGCVLHAEAQRLSRD